MVYPLTIVLTMDCMILQLGLDARSALQPVILHLFGGQAMCLPSPL